MLRAPHRTPAILQAPRDLRDKNMLGAIITDVFAEPEAYVCLWHDGELFIGPIGDVLVPASEIEGVS